MTTTTIYTKDPDAVLDYKVDWSAWLAANETISASAWIVSGVTKDSDSHDDTSATVWLSGGAVGGRYSVTNRIVTNQGRTDDRSLTIRVMQR